MNRKLKASLILIGGFILLTAALCFVDLQPIGPGGSPVGFGTVNELVQKTTGVHFILYALTDWLSLIPLGIALGFGCMGLAQCMKRRSFQKVDRNLIILGIFYLVLIGIYLLFEALKVNYRPILINGVLEASYPSSTTMLAICIMITASRQWEAKIKGEGLKKWLCIFTYGFVLFMVLGRLVSGVHWLTDILGGILLSAGLVLLYDFFCKRFQ